MIATPTTTSDRSVELPIGTVPCETCGVAVPLDELRRRGGRLRTVTVTAREFTDEEIARLDQLGRTPPMTDLRIGECEQCAQRADLALALLRGCSDGRRLLAREGVFARSRAEMTLAALAAIDREAAVSTAADSASAALLRFIPSIAPHTMALSYAGWARPGRCNLSAFDHLSAATRAALRAGYGDALRVRMLAKSEPVKLAPTIGAGCGWCGVAAISLSAVEVHRRGGPDAARSSCWTPHRASSTALGGRSGGEIAFALCWRCERAYAQFHSIGTSGREKAFLDALRAEHDGKGRQLWPGRSLDVVPLAWVVTGLPPVDVPWSFVPSGVKNAALSALHLDSIVTRTTG